MNPLSTSDSVRASARDIDGINHVGLVVRSMDDAAHAYEQMGFRLTPVSMHVGSPQPSGTLEEYGTGNRTAVFAGNYVEILAVFDPSKYDYGFSAWLERHEGARILTFGCGDAELVTERLTRRELAHSGVVSLQRDIDTPSGTATAHFSCVIIPDEGTPEGLVQAAQHHDPELIHQPRYMDHPNGALAVTDVYLATSDPEMLQRRYEDLTNQRAEQIGPLKVIQLPAGRVTIINRDDLSEALPGATVDDDPSFVAFGIGVRSLKLLRSLLVERDVTHLDHDGRVHVPAQAAGSASLVFEAVT